MIFEENRILSITDVILTFPSMDPAVRVNYYTKSIVYLLFDMLYLVKKLLPKFIFGNKKATSHRFQAAPGLAPRASCFDRSSTSAETGCHQTMTWLRISILSSLA